MINRSTSYALAAVFLWSTLAAATKLAVQDIDPFSVAVSVGLVACLALFVNLVIRSKTRLIMAEFLKHPVFFISLAIVLIAVLDKIRQLAHHG